MVPELQERFYTRGIPKTGRQQAVCWLQNARILDSRKELPQLLFPPDVLEEIVDIYYRQSQTKTRIYNHSIGHFTMSYPINDSLGSSH